MEHSRITVAELIKRLGEMPQNATVEFTSEIHAHILHFAQLENLGVGIVTILLAEDLPPS